MVISNEARCPHVDNGIIRRDAVTGDTIGGRSARIFGRWYRTCEDSFAWEGRFAIDLAAGEE